jgi:hypothetical protein
MSPSFFDKAKDVAQQAIDEAKKGVDAGQAKLDEVQVKREAGRVLSALGAAFYAEQRGHGDREAVNAALQAVDRHVAEHGWSGFPGVGDPPPPAPPAPPATP